MSRSLAIGIGVYVVLLGALAVTIVADTPPPLRIALDHSRNRPQGGMYTLALPPPSVLNPFTAEGAVAKRMILPYTHDALMEFDPANGELRPSLAERVEELDGGTRLIFTLRRDVRFSNGARLTMADVMFLYELNQAGVPLGLAGGALTEVQSMRPLDNTRLEVRLKRRLLNSTAEFATGYVVGNRVWFLAQVVRIAKAAGSEVPKLGDERFGALFAEIVYPGPGTGPYQFERWTRGEDLYLVQNPYSWRRAARPDDWNLGGVRIVFGRDSAACVAMAKRGELDLFLSANPKEACESDPELARTHRPLVYHHQRNGHFVLFWNHRDRKRHLDKPAVRRALTKLCDRQRFASEVFEGAASPLRSWFRPGSQFEPKADVPFDPKGARKELADAGVSNLSLQILIAAGQPQQRKMMELAAPVFADAGIQLEVVPMERTALEASSFSGEFQGILLVISMTPGVADPFWYFHESQIPPNGRNFMGWRHAEASRLLSVGRSSLDPTERADAYAKFNKIFLSEQPCTMLVHGKSSVVMSRRFRGVDENLGQLGLIFEKWWLPPAK